jgi:hypothetical protein
MGMMSSGLISLDRFSARVFTFEDYLATANAFGDACLAFTAIFGRLVVRVLPVDTAAFPDTMAASSPTNAFISAWAFSSSVG